MPWDFWLIFVVLGVVLPLRGRARLGKLLAIPHVGMMERLSLYASTMAFQWIIAVLVAWRAWAHGFTAAELGMMIDGKGPFGRNRRCRDVGSSPVAQPAPNRSAPSRGARVAAVPRRAYLPAISRGNDSLLCSRGNCWSVRRVSLSRFCLSGNYPSWIARLGGSRYLLYPLRVGAHLPGPGGIYKHHASRRSIRCGKDSLPQSGSCGPLAFGCGSGGRHGGPTVPDPALRFGAHSGNEMIVIN